MTIIYIYTKFKRKSEQGRKKGPTVDVLSFRIFRTFLVLHEERNHHELGNDTVYIEGFKADTQRQTTDE